MGWAVPGDAMRLAWSNTSPNEKTVLDFAYMQISEDGENVSIYFLVTSSQKRLTTTPGSMKFAGVNGTLVNTYKNDNDDNGKIKYIVWKATLPVSKSLQSNALYVSTNQGGHSIDFSNFAISNLNFETEHYIYSTDPEAATLKMTTPGAGFPGQIVTAKPIKIFGYEYTYVAGLTKTSATIPTVGKLVLKLYYKQIIDVNTIVIRGVDQQTEYTGSEIYLSALAGGNGPGTLYNVTIPGNDPANGETYRIADVIIVADVSRTDVGTSEQVITMTGTPRIEYNGANNSDGYLDSNQWEDVTDWFTGTAIINGSLGILPNSTVIEITAASGEKEYDGSPLKDPGFIHSILPPGVTEVKAIVDGSQIDVGWSNNVVTGYTLWNGEQEVTDFFAPAKLIDGILTVTNNKTIKITITAASDEKEYDGAELTDAGFTANDPLPGGITEVRATVSGTRTDVGTEDNVITEYSLWNGGVEVTDYFNEATLVKGALRIDPRPAKVTADNAGKYYLEDDPEPFTVTMVGFLPGDEPSAGQYSVARPGAGTDETIGTYPDALVVTNLGFNNENYIVNWINGTFNIRDNPVFDGVGITVTGNSHTIEYNGTERTAAGYTTSGVPNGFSVAAITSDPAAVNVYETPLANTVSDVVVTYRGVDVTNLVTVTTVSGALVITPVDVIIAANSYTKVYGNADPVFTAVVTGLADDDKLDYTMTREEGENVDTYAISVTYVDNPNYKVIKVTGGILEISPRAITITADDKSKVYGAADPALTATFSGLAEGDTTVFAYTIERESGELIGGYEIYVEANAEDYLNYIITLVNGTLEITEKEVTITADDLSKIYMDADPGLTATLSEDVVDVINYTLSREPGENVGEYVIIVTPGANPGYTVNTVNGMFIIDPAPLVITVLDQTVQQGTDENALHFNLTAVELKGPDAGKEGTVIGGEAIYKTDYTSFARAGDTFPVEVSGLVAENYDISYVPGTIDVIAGTGGNGTTGTTGGTTNDGGTTGTTGGGTTGTTGGGITIDPPVAGITTTINGMETPLAGSLGPLNADRPPLVDFASWALLNLILTIVTGLITLALFATYFMKRKQEEAEFESKYRPAGGAEFENEREEIKKRLLIRVLSIVATVAAIILFVITQDMTLPIAFVDNWTIGHIVIVAAAIFIAYLSRKKYEVIDETLEEETL